MKILSVLSSKKEDAGGWNNFLFHSSLTLTFTSGMSYMLGLVRDKVFAYSFGASSQLDIYNAAFTVPDFLFAVLVSGALSAAFVPIFTGLYEKDKKKAFEYTNQVLSFILLSLSVFSVIFGICLPFFAHYLVKGFSVAQQNEYILVTRIMLFAPFFFALSNAFGNALLSTRDFLWYGLSPVLYNIFIVFGALVLSRYWGISGLVLGTVLGAGFHMLVRGQAMFRHGFRLKFSLRLSSEIQETLALMLPKMAQIGMWQFMLLWFVNLASQTGEGGVTKYNFAYNFQSVPVSLIGMALALASFSHLSHLAAQKNFQSFKKIIKTESIKILVLTTLSALALAMISTPLIQFLLGGGKFTDSAVRFTSSLLKVYAFSIPLESLMHLLARAHYALKNTLRPSLIHISAITLSMVLSSTLLPHVGLYALPIAFSTGFGFQCIFLAISLAELLQQKETKTVRLFGKILLRFTKA